MPAIHHTEDRDERGIQLLCGKNNTKEEAIYVYSRWNEDVHFFREVESWVKFSHPRKNPQSTYIFNRDETGLVYLPTQLERTLQLYW
jgi:hypothetical protein